MRPTSDRLTHPTEMAHTHFDNIVIEVTRLYDGVGDEMSDGKVQPDEVRKSPTIGGWLESDNRAVPDIFSRASTAAQTCDDLPVERYLSRAFHERETSRMWSRAWQMACHQDEIPEVGDYVVYDIGAVSHLIVRASATEIRALRNVCLHRGMLLRDEDGHANAFTCPFHGWSWNLDGTMRRLPEKWDFPHIDMAANCLPQAKVARWGGFIFINMDAGAEPFETYIGSLSEHFARAPLENRRVAGHFARVLPANWKVAMEAFMESYHVSPTHPEVVPISQYAETQYDIYPDEPNISRMLTVSVAQATPMVQALSDQEFADYVTKMTGREPVDVPEGATFRAALAEQRRGQIGQAQGAEVSHLTDVEMLDAVEYYLFPNFLPWNGFGLPIAYRFRPNGDRHDSSIMEVYLLAARNLAEKAPRAVPIEWVGEGQGFSDVPGLGRLGPIFDQDYVNIERVQKGLRATAKPGVTLAQYQESRIRHYHNRIDDFIND